MTNEERGARSEERVVKIADSGARSEEELNPQSTIHDPASLQRVRWRCRRGLLELDIVLGRFVEAHYAKLTEAERQIFEEFLDMPDNPLWDMISGRQDAVSGEHAALLEKIKLV
ncbi:MAG: succinate dehydrogenase assembly factor 2 [Gallionella sp.]|jgi:antitoxin CptB